MTIAIDGMVPAQPLGPMVFQWFFSQPTIGDDVFQWLPTIGPTMRWQRYIVPVYLACIPSSSLLHLSIYRHWWWCLWCGCCWCWCWWWTKKKKIFCRVSQNLQWKIISKSSPLTRMVIWSIIQSFLESSHFNQFWFSWPGWHLWPDHPATSSKISASNKHQLQNAKCST